MIGIFNAKGGFSDSWIEYCESNNIEYKFVDIYSNDIIAQTDDCDIILAHPIQYDLKSELVFRQVIYSLEHAGRKVFPDFRTLWHFDDKVGQKFLLEAIKAPFVKSYVFTNYDDALSFIDNTDFPKVLKLRGGAGSSNVKLVSNKESAKNWIRKAFGKGINQYDGFDQLKEKYRKYKLGRSSIKDLFYGIIRLFIKPKYFRVKGNDYGYIYFQDFLDNNKSDIRIIVLGKKAFGIRRLVRENDFRASGSGNIIYDHNQIDIRCVEVAFEVNQMLNSQCIAYDFIFDRNNMPVIIEISYGFVPNRYEECDGYWTEDMKWHNSSPDPCGWIIENLRNKSGEYGY